MTVCGECFEKQQAWLDYRPAPPIKIAQSGPPRWNVPWGERVIETIRSQLDVIQRICKRDHQQEARHGR